MGIAGKVVLCLIGFVAGVSVVGHSDEFTKVAGAICFTLVIATAVIVGELARLRNAIEDARLTPDGMAEALRAAARKTKAPADGPPPVPKI